MPHPYNTGIRDEVPALAHEGMWQSVITGDVGLTHASVNWNFAARQFHVGSSEDHTLSRPCFVKDGPTGSIHKRSGLDGVDEKFVWNEG